MRLDVERLGSIIKDLRLRKSLSQQALGESLVPAIPRTAISRLERGKRLPSPDVLEQIAEYIDLPRPLWEPFAHPESRVREEFESILGELVGVPVSLERLYKEAIETATETIQSLFREKLNDSQAYDRFCRLLVYYGVLRTSRVFFDHYLKAKAFVSINAFRLAVESYQMDAVRLYSTFHEAYQTLNGHPQLKKLLQPLQARNDRSYRDRKSWSELQLIEESHLPDLGYISAVRIRKELKEREVLSNYLKELAQAIRENGSTAIAEISIRRQRKMDALLRKFDSELPHGPISPLFSPAPTQLEQEAERIAPSGHGELDRIALTQRKGLANLSRYLTADYMDVYVATSMRAQADFVSVNRFVSRLFAHTQIKPLKLRFFNPTQSWIEDRVAKGLVEALMLRRADYTFYMAQKSDTFGKDSEASVALGQGKPVIVYVPRLFVATEKVNIDTNALANSDEETLKRAIRSEGGEEELEIDDTLDKEGLHAHLVSIRLRQLNTKELAQVVHEHWADFDLFSEAERISDPTERDTYRLWLNSVIKGPKAEPINPDTRAHLIQILVAIAMRFERRAKLFREVHPLALQVILSTGVLNGMLVARSIDSCANLLHHLIQNKLDFELHRDQDNYRLIEVSTRSTVRVIPRNQLIASAFETFYTKFGQEKRTELE